jgi:hypothetical protein
MTCRDILSLLDDFIDHDLGAEVAARVQTHLDECPSCRAEYGRSLQLKALLQRDAIPEPPAEYWTEVSAIIQARTVDSVPLIRERAAEERVTSRRGVYRSVAVFAASAVLLATTLLVSYNRHERSAKNSEPAAVYVTSRLSDRINHPLSEYITRQDQTRISGGTLVVGAPSMVGRYSSLAGITLTY